MNPRVLFLDHSGALGGAELYLLDVAQGLADTSHVSVFADGPFPERLATEGLPHTVLGAGDAVLSVTRGGALGTLLQAVPEVARLTWRVARQARHYDVVYANSQKALIIGGLAAALARRPLVWNLHDILTADHFSAGMRRLAVGWSNLFARHVVVNSQATEAAYRSSGGRMPTTVVYNGIDAQPFDVVTDEEVQRVRQDLGLSGGPVVGVFSRLAAWKGQHVLIEALRQAPQWNALLVGDALFGPDAAYAETLYQLAQEHGLADRVQFVGFRSDVAVLMKAVDAVAHTSTAAEPFGRVVVEGMLSGTPVIAMDAGGPREIVTHGQTGLLVPPEDPQAMAAALQWLQAHPEAVRRMTAAADSRAQTRFSVARMRADLAAVIDAVACG